MLYLVEKKPERFPSDILILHHHGHSQRKLNTHHMVVVVVLVCFLRFAAEIRKIPQGAELHWKIADSGFYAYL